MVSIPDLAEEEFIGREPVKETPIGCSGVATARLLQVREPLSAPSRAEADEMLYVVAGDATLRLGEGVQSVTPGWFSIVPRGTEYLLTRRGRNPVILLSVVAGQPCADSPSRSDR
jgi:mannose-6-phosphate isomerase-like protein (cupin superfamily)